MELESNKKVRLNPITELGIVSPQQFSWEVCRIFENSRDTRYLYYTVREYPKWMAGEYHEWFMNYREDDDFVPAMAIATCAFFCPDVEEGTLVKRLAKEYISQHYRETHFLPDIYLLFTLMAKIQFADMITSDKQKQRRVIGYCLREVYDYDRCCFKFPKEDITINVKPMIRFQECAYPMFYEKFVLNTPPFTPEEEKEIRELLGINSEKAVRPVRWHRESGKDDDSFPALTTD